MATIDFEQVFEALPSPYMLLDCNLRFVAANGVYRKTTGRSFDELRGQHVMEMFPNPGEGGPRLLASLEKVVATGEPDTLAYLPYPIPNGDGGFDNRYWTVVHTPIASAGGEVAFILQNTVDVTEFARLREAATLPFPSLSAQTSLIERTREAEAASADFRRLFQQAPGFFAVMSGPEHIFTFASDSYLRLIGGRNVIGRPIRTALPEIVEQGFGNVLDRVYGDGIAHSAESARVMLENAPGRPAVETFLDFNYAPIRAGDGRISGVFVQGMDRTESVRAEARQRLLIDELNHRVKNALATVQSIATLTLRSKDDLDEARRSFEARIVALSRAHTMLSERQWADTAMGDVVQQELRTYAARQVRIGGPHFAINAKTTLALALLLHELATNAAQHGALSVPAGTLAVTWRAADDALVIEWQERSGPAAAPPQRRGFGSRMLNSVVTGELGGTLDARYEPVGFSATMTIPKVAYAQPVAALDD